MAEQSELLERLQDLQRLSKKKKYKLVKAEQEEALSALLELFATGEENYGIILRALPNLPSDVGATFLAEKWGTLIEAKPSVYFDLRQHKFTTDLGKRLRIALAQRLLNSHSDSSLRLLLETFKDMKLEKTPTPTSKDLGIIRSALVKPAGRSLEQLPIRDTKIPDLPLLPTYILAATFVKDKKSKKPLPAETQLALIRWANGFPELPQLPQEIGSAVVQAVKTWDEDFRRILAPEINKGDTALRKLLLPVCREGVPKEPSEDLPKITPLPTPEAAHVVQPAEQQQPYDALKEIERLGEYVRGLKNRLEQSQQKCQAVGLKLQQTRQELGAARRKLEETHGRLRSQRETANRLTEEKEGLAKEMASLRINDQRLTQELENAQNLHNETKNSLSEQLDVLSERIASEGEHRVNSFRNKLSEKLHAYADGLNEAKDMEMTIELGEALRNQMAQLFSLLKTEGFRIEGGQ